MNVTPIEIGSTVFAILLVIMFLSVFNAFFGRLMDNVQQSYGQHFGNDCVRNCGTLNRDERKADREENDQTIIIPQVLHRGEIKL